MGNSLLAVVSTRRPGQDSVSANAELVRWTGIRPWPSPWSTRTRSHRSRCIAGSDRMVLGEHPRALGESTFVAASYDQAKSLQDTADLTIDLDAHIDEPTANAQ